MRFFSKTYFQTILEKLLDEMFPRLCLCCKEFEAARWFCSTCWDLLSLPDPKQRCRHCFASSESLLCPTCRKEPVLFLPRAWVFDASLPSLILQKHQSEIEEALASFAFLLHDKLKWPSPDAVAAIADEAGDPSIFRVAEKLANFLNCPYVKIFKRTYRGFLQPDLVVSADGLKAQQTFLLVDGASSLSWLKCASEKFSEVLAERAMILSLFGE